MARHGSPLPEGETDSEITLADVWEARGWARRNSPDTEFPARALLEAEFISEENLKQRRRESDLPDLS
jgi:hypothetical protein